jgi:UDP-N-acetylmuramoyl-L-alanyl-D-glutamate--2,6-diaminopimelate ligase
MKLLSDILYKVSLEEVIGSTHTAISSVTFDSKNVKKDTLFIAIKGTAVNGHQFIEKAIISGSVAIVCEELPTQLNDNVTYIKVKDTSYALGIIACNYYDNPSEKIKLVGVTGTNGKTTTVTLLFNLFKALGYNVGLLSTVQNKINNTIIQSTHTTPDALSLNELLSEMVKQGCEYAFMEVSFTRSLFKIEFSGITFYRCRFFTNITHDHLDYHKNVLMSTLKLKKRFFLIYCQNSAFCFSK